jgi:hypothetical protein
MTDPIAAVADEITTPELGQNLQYAQLRQGVITAINASDNSCTLLLSGDTSTPVPGVKCLRSYQPVVSDTIWALKSGTDLLGLGTVNAGTFTAYAQAQNFVTSNNVISAAGFFTLTSSPNSVTLTKRYATSNLLVTMSITGWGDNNVGGGQILETAISIGGTDYIVGACNCTSYSNTLPAAWVSPRVTATGSTVIPSIAAGSVTAVIRIRNLTAVGNIHVDTGDFYSLTVLEIL